MRPLSIVLSLFAAGCATAAKPPALPPGPGPAPAASDAPTGWYSPFSTDDTSPRRATGAGVTAGLQPWLTKDVKAKLDYGSGVTVETPVKPAAGPLLGVHFDRGLFQVGGAFGWMPLEVGALELHVRVAGLQGAIRIPLALAEFRRADLQLHLVPALEVHALRTMGGSDLGWKADAGFLAGGSLNGVGLALSHGDRIMLEADVVRLAWNTFRLDLRNPGGRSVTTSFSALSAGFAPSLTLRALF